MKFASCALMARPKPSSFRLYKLEEFDPRFLERFGVLAHSARWAVGVEMLYGALAFERTWMSVVVRWLSDRYTGSGLIEDEERSVRKYG
jgi:hypothetical protein